MNMTPRERVLAAVRGEEVFPIPTTSWKTKSIPLWSGNWPAILACRKKITWAFCAPWERTPAGGNRLTLARRWPKPLSAPDPWPNKKSHAQHLGRLERMNTYSDTIDRPLGHVETTAQVEAHPWPDPDWFDYTRIGWFEDAPAEYPAIAEWAPARRGLRPHRRGFDPIFSRVLDLCGIEKGLMMSMMRPICSRPSSPASTDFMEEFYRRIAEAGRDAIDFIASATTSPASADDDRSGTLAPLFRPRLEAPLRRAPQIWDEGADALLRRDSPGARRPDRRRTGRFRKSFRSRPRDGRRRTEARVGKDLTFYGGLDTQQILPTAARKRCAPKPPPGRYLRSRRPFHPGQHHLFQQDVPPINVLAMIEEPDRISRLFRRRARARARNRNSPSRSITMTMTMTK